MKFYFRTPIYFLLAASAIGFSSCDNRPDIAGAWTGTPTRINEISAAADASATMTFVFSNDNANGKSESGDVMISALIDANQPVSSTVNGMDTPYEVSVASTATIHGRWTFEDDEDDDILLTLNPESLEVIVDPHGVTFSSNILTGTQQPMLDSLTTATAQAWKRSISQAIGNEFYKIQKISDIKIKNGIMSCEINDRDYIFRQTE